MTTMNSRITTPIHSSISKPLVGLQSRLLYKQPRAGGGIDGWFDLASFVATSSTNKSPYEELSDAIGKDCYIDVAGWHLFLKDVKVEGQTSLASVLGTKLGQDMMSRGSCDGRDIEDALKKVPVKLGQGKVTVALKDVMPSMCVSDLVDLCEEYAKRNL